MKAILVNDDKSLRWDDVPTAVCGEDDCLVKIEAAAADYVELTRLLQEKENQENTLMELMEQWENAQEG